MINFKEILNQVVNFLEENEKNYGIKYYLVGGIMVSLYAENRTTNDIDFVVDIFSANYSIQSYVEMLKQSNFYPIQDWNSSISLAQETYLLQYFDQSNRIKLDNYILLHHTQNKYKKLGKFGLKRRVRVKFLDIECWAVSKEDYILSKLVFGGWQDFSDALGCWLRYTNELDINYLENISKELDVEKEMNLLMSGIEDPDEYFDALEG